MAAIVIPLIDTPRQSLSVTIDGQLLKLTVDWQPSDRKWYVSLEHPPGTTIIAGRRITLNEPLLGEILTPLRGSIWCRSLIGPTAEPGEHAWGDNGTHRLIHQP